MMNVLLFFQVIQLQGDQRKNVATFLVQVIYMIPTLIFIFVQIAFI